MARLVRGHDWGSTPLGPAKRWPPRLKAAVEQVLASPMVASLAWGPERLFFYNDAAVRLFADRHPGVLGRPLGDAFPDAYPVVATFYDRVFAGESLHVPGQALDTAGNGEPFVFDAYLMPVRDDAGAVAGALMVGAEIGARVRAESALRESEERQAFLLTLGDALRPLADATDIMREATRLLGRKVGASRVFYVVVEADGDSAVIHGDYVDGVPSRTGRYSLSAFSASAAEEWRAGRVASTSDTEADPRWSEAERRAYRSVSTRAGFGVPLIKQGRLTAILGVNQATPRRWTDGEIDLAREVAERTWAAVERALAEAALRESEERQAFLLKLSDALRPLTGPLDVQERTCHLLGEQLGLDSVGYGVIDEAAETIVVAREFRRDGAVGSVGSYRFADFDWIFRILRDGRNVVMDDATVSPRSPKMSARIRRRSATPASWQSLCSRAAALWRSSPPNPSPRAIGGPMRLGFWRKRSSGPGKRSSAPAPRRRCATARSVSASSAKPRRTSCGCAMPTPSSGST